MTRRTRHRLAALAALVMGLALPAALDLPPTPWPAGRPPSELELEAAVQDAERLADRERADALLEAWERGEDREHFDVVQADVDAERWSLDRLFRAGDAFFEHRFTPDEGFGPAPSGTLRRVHGAQRGGPDAYSCAACHAQGGPDGAGTEVGGAFFHGDGERTDSAVVRDAPAVLGLGFVQALGAELSRDLAWQRAVALADAADAGTPVRVALETHGVRFGALTAQPDGGVDTHEVEGVSPDLVVRPFGWRGTNALLRRVVEEAALEHQGLQSVPLVEAARMRPDPRLGDGPNPFDPDGDGVVNELTEGTLTAVAVYLALLEVPVVLPPSDQALAARWSRGHQLFARVGCEACHRETLELLDRQWRELPDTTSGGGVLVRLLQDGDAPRGTGSVHLFSDLKRHAMGPGLAQGGDDGSGLPADVFLTRPLWGLADSAPYLHDGRAATIPDAILAHGGEAQESRDAFAALDVEQQKDLHVFLLSLTRTPRPRYAR